MNPALPPGNRGDRDSDPGRPSGCGGAVPSAGRLVRGTEAAAWTEERKAAEVRPRRLKVQSGKLGFCRVSPLPVRPLLGRNRQAHFLAEGAADEASD